MKSLIKNNFGIDILVFVHYDRMRTAKSLITNQWAGAGEQGGVDGYVAEHRTSVSEESMRCTAADIPETIYTGRSLAVGDVDRTHGDDPTPADHGRDRRSGPLFPT